MIRSLVDAPTPGMPRSARETVPLFTPASRATSAIVVRRVVARGLVAITQVWVSAGTKSTIRLAAASSRPFCPASDQGNRSKMGLASAHPPVRGECRGEVLMIDAVGEGI
jgi:hypothetical protein